MIKRIVLLMIVFVLSLSAPALAAEPGTGMIEGWVVNGTEGGGSVADLDVILKTYLDDAEVGSTTAKTNDEGSFVFDGLSNEPGYSYGVALTFQEADYYSERLIFNEGETSKSVELIVYDSITSDEAIKVVTAHTIVYVEQGRLRVQDYSLFVNDSDRTYIGSKVVTTGGAKETLRFSLPKDVTALKPGYGLMECCITDSEEGFTDTMPVFPGISEIVYSYEISHNSGTYTFSRNVNYPTTKYDLLFQGESIEVTGDQMAAGEPITIEGTQFSHLTGEALAPGDILVVKLSGLPGTNNQGAAIWVALTLIVLAGGFGLGYLLRKKRVQPVRPEDSLDQRRQRLLIELAQLDDDFDEGKIPEEAYRKLRNEMKARLVELIQRSKEESGRR